MIKVTKRNAKHNEVRKWAKKKKKEIFERANNKCDKCGTEEDLSIHHLEYKKGYEYLQVLCNRCHRRFHNKELQKKLQIYYYNELCRQNEDMSIKELKDELKQKIESNPLKIITPLKLDGI